jgi:hypothetical protein
MRSNPQTNNVTVDARPNIRPGVLSVVVPYTTPQLTRAALRHSAVCSDLDIQVCLVDIQVVPFPRPLDEPPINKEFSEHRLHDLFEESGLSGQTSVLYARDRLEGYRRMLEPKSLVVLATKKRWWPTRERRLARALSKAGHQVMLLPIVG